MPGSIDESARVFSGSHTNVDKAPTEQGHAEFHMVDRLGVGRNLIFYIMLTR